MSKALARLSDLVYKNGIWDPDFVNGVSSTTYYKGKNGAIYTRALNAYLKPVVSGINHMSVVTKSAEDDLIISLSVSGYSYERGLFCDEYNGEETAALICAM